MNVAVPGSPKEKNLCHFMNCRKTQLCNSAINNCLLAYVIQIVRMMIVIYPTPNIGAETRHYLYVGDTSLS